MLTLINKLLPHQWESLIIRNKENYHHRISSCYVSAIYTASWDLTDRFLYVTKLQGLWEGCHHFKAQTTLSPRNDMYLQLIVFCYLCFTENLMAAFLMFTGNISFGERKNHHPIIIRWCSGWMMVVQSTWIQHRRLRFASWVLSYI